MSSWSSQCMRCAIHMAGQGTPRSNLAVGDDGLMCTAAPPAVPLGLSWDDGKGREGGGVVKRPCHYFTYRPTSSSTCFALHPPMYYTIHKWHSLSLLFPLTCHTYNIRLNSRTLYCVEYILVWTRRRILALSLFCPLSLPTHLSLQATLPLPLVLTIPSLECPP